jgi:hypothetical protein
MSTPQQYIDKVLRCVDCDADFVFEAGEQAFFMAKMPPLQEPKRCPSCRKRRRETIAREPVPHQRPDRFDPTRRWRDLYPNGDRGRP